MPVKVELLEERWTRTSVQAAFTFHSLPSLTKSVAIDLPLLNLGWTFTLSLTPQRRSLGPTGRSRRALNWIPALLSFRRPETAITWGNTSLHAQLSLTEMCNPLTTLGEFDIVLAQCHTFQLDLHTPCIISSREHNKVWLTVTVLECPFPNGLFDARFGPVNEAQVQAQLVRQSGDRVLSRSLETGKLFDVKFLACSSLTTCSSSAYVRPTYASLSVLERHVDISSSTIKESWENAITALDNSGGQDIEIACPEDDQYELDSDYDDDEDADETTLSDSECARDLAALGGEQSDSGTERSSSSLSSFEPVSQPEGLFRRAHDIPSNNDPERTIWVRFAAHRTWHAFLWYCYTGNLEFCNLKSQDAGAQHLRAMPVDGGPPPCSPKSMYRLADLVGNQDLKAKSLAAIKERMTEANVLDETFSLFSFRYPEVREVQLGVLMEHCGSPKVKAAFLKAMKEYRNMPHAEHVLSAFYDNLCGPTILSFDLRVRKSEKKEERWTSTTIETAYVLLASDPRSSTITIDLPLVNLGWIFGLSLTPGQPPKKAKGRVPTKRWAPTAFSFRTQDRAQAVPWKNTSLHARLSLAVDKPEDQNQSISSIPSGNDFSRNDRSNAITFATFDVVLRDTPSLNLPLALSSTDKCTLSRDRPYNIWLTLTISECPLDNGFFDAYLDRALVEEQVAMHRSDRLLSRSLTTGRPFDVKFLASSTRSPSGNTGELLSTYASLGVLESRVDMASSILGESWTNALATLENADTKVIQEISCPKDYDYELDSDFEDEDANESPLPGGSDHKHDPAISGSDGARQAQHLEDGTKRSNSSLSSFESVDRPKDESPSSYERLGTIVVKFAAHRTWHTFLWYCYTGDVQFCKLKSQVEPGCGHLHGAICVEGGQPVCSPKSMYRLADLLGNKDLKAKALAAIKARMSKANILDETFSVFTSRYSEVRNVELAILMRHCKSPDVKEAFLRVMEKYGNMPHAKPVLSAFYDKLVDLS